MVSQRGPRSAQGVSPGEAGLNHCGCGGAAAGTIGRKRREQRNDYAGSQDKNCRYSDSVSKRHLSSTAALDVSAKTARSIIFLLRKVSENCLIFFSLKGFSSS